MAVLLCLHGWGGSKESFDPLKKALSGSGIEVFTLDLPGFGSESDPSRPWNNDDYVDFVTSYIAKTIQGPYALLGHSFGGRIILKIASSENPSLNKPTHIYLCAAAGIKHPRHIKRILGLTLAKSGKFFLSLPGMKIFQPIGKKLLYKLIRIHDYEIASPIMRQTLINVTREDLRPLLSKISLPTDIFWGEEDEMTPLCDAYIMQREIVGSQLQTFPGVRHRVHQDKAQEISQIIRARMTHQ